jgi:hypothetical protein
MFPKISFINSKDPEPGGQLIKNPLDPDTQLRRNYLIGKSFFLKFPSKSLFNFQKAAID